jgi:endonuclease/exonuclease/phosphatase family metal-dependent hydrolase
VGETPATRRRQTFCWFNTHFDAFSGRVRAKSAALLRDRMIKIAGTMPCVVTGDFNASPRSTPYRTLLAEQSPRSSSLHDAFRAAHPVAARGEGTVHFFTGWRGGPRMDWILASAHFQTIAADIDHTRELRGYSSDHFPVIATLRAR